MHSIYRFFCSTIFLITISLGIYTQIHAADIGVYYFPGWSSNSKYWKDLKGITNSRSPGKSWPDREPLLGFYPEEQAWVAEKHIEWSTNYGITFFAYDWYWNGKTSENNHAIDNFLKAKNKSKLKFVIHWANAYANPSNLQDFTFMVDFWIQNYFQDPQYLKIDNKPVIIIFLPQKLRDNAAKFGMTSKDLLNLARSKAKEKGLAGIYFIGTTPASAYWVNDYLPKNGYDAITAHDYHSKGFNGAFTDNVPKATSYSELLDGYKSQWQWILKNSSLPYIVPMTAGWDQRPWGSNTPHDNCSSTPESFKIMLTEGKSIMNRFPEKTMQIGIIYAWNEFGEGGYIEPTKKWGFQYLQAIKDVFEK